MISLQQLIGLPIIAISNGKQLGNVRDVWFNEYWRLQGLILQHEAWTKKVKVVFWSSVVSCGTDTVFIKAKHQIETVKNQQIQRGYCTGIIQLKDIPVVTVTGTQLGRVSDVYFHPLQDTQIIGYELSDGFVSDLIEGRKWFRVPNDADQVLLGQDVIIVPAISESELEPVAASNFKN